MLLTTCTTCAAQFKVLPEHLNVRQGRVMCGRCRTVFNAFETLKRVEDELPVMPTPYFPTSVPTSASTSTAGAVMGVSAYAQIMPPASSASPYHLPDNEFSAPAATTTGWAARDDATGRFTPLLETLLSPDLLSPMPLSPMLLPPTPHDQSAGHAAIDDEPDATEPSAMRTSERSDDSDSFAPAALIAPEKFSALDDDEIATQPPTSIGISRREPTIGARDLRQLSGDVVHDPLLATRLESPLEFSAGPVSDSPLMATDPLEEVEPYTGLNLRDEKPKNSRRWAVLCGAMVIILAAQFVFYFRHSLAETYPQLRPTLASACASLGCRLSWARDTAAIEVKGSELVELPSKPGRMLANAVLVNRGKVTQEYPAIELRLTNNTNQIVMSRILQPSDYVARPVAVAGSPEPGGVDKTIVEKGFAPNAEVALSLTIEVPPKTAASGYEFLPFYP